MAHAPVLHIYYAAKPLADIPDAPLVPPQRQAEVAACNHARLRTDKYYVWRLLALGLKDTFGWDMQDLAIQKDPCGKWVCDTCFFSLSHGDMPQGDGAVLAVAVSTAPVGVDIEHLRPLPSGIQRRILSAEEQNILANLSEERRTQYLIEQWTKKESAFKLSGTPHFLPTHTDLTHTASRRVSVDGAPCILSVASPLDMHARFTLIPTAALL